MLYISNFVLEKNNIVMKKTVIIFVLAALVLASLVLWALNTQFSGGMPEALMILVGVVVVGFAVFFGIARVRSAMHNEPAEDELSRMVMTKASSLSFFISIYWWLFMMYISDKTELPTHSLIGAGILGMALIFLGSWIGVKFNGVKNE